MIALYLVCFVLGFVLSLLAAFSGLGRVHLGHFHVHGGHTHVKAGGAPVSAFNGFTMAAFLCWFGGAGYLLGRYTPLLGVLVALASIAAGLTGASLLYGLLFKLLLPHESVLSADDTRMEGTLARVSDEVRARDGIGEILFTQTGARRSAPARSEDGHLLARGTEVVVLRYERGIAYVRPLQEVDSPALPDSFSSNL